MESKVAEGEALAPLEDRGYTIYVTEAGAVPYYSGWDSLDNMGLVDEHITHRGLSKEYLEEVSPELIMLGKADSDRDLWDKFPTEYEYMVDHGYLGVTAVVQTARSVHVYFVLPGPSADEIAAALLESDELDLRDVEDFIRDDLDVWSPTRGRRG